MGWRPKPARPALDPRWDWVEVHNIGRVEPHYVPGRCNHLELEPVTSVSGEVVAQLCRTCDAQLPPPSMVGRW